MEEFYDRPIKELLPEWQARIDELKATLLSGKAVATLEGYGAPNEAEGPQAGAEVNGAKDKFEGEAGEAEAEAEANGAKDKAESEAATDESGLAAGAAEGEAQRPVKKMSLAELPEDEKLLRFLVTFAQSESPVEAAAVAVRESILNNAKCAAMMKLIEEVEELEDEKTVKRYFKFDLWELGRKDSPPLSIMRVGYSTPSELMDALAHEKVVQALLCIQLRLWKKLEKRQRETGKFSLTCICVDCTDTAISQVYDDRFMKAAKEATYTAQSLHPSMSVKTAVVNTGWVWRMLFGLISSFLPARAQAKVRVCGASDTRSEDPADCPYLQRLGITKEDLPDFLGGSVAVPESHSLFVRMPEPALEEESAGWFG